MSTVADFPPLPATPHPTPPIPIGRIARIPTIQVSQSLPISGFSLDQRVVLSRKRSMSLTDPSRYGLISSRLPCSTEALRQQIKDPSAQLRLIIGTRDPEELDKFLNIHPQAANKHFKNGDLPLTLAVRLGRDRVTEVLLGGGAHVNVASEHGEAALHVATHACRDRQTFCWEILNHLKARGADPLMRDNQGWTSVHYAIRAASTGLLHLFRTWPLENGQKIHWEQFLLDVLNAPGSSYTWTAPAFLMLVEMRVIDVQLLAEKILLGSISRELKHQKHPCELLLELMLKNHRVERVGLERLVEQDKDSKSQRHKKNILRKYKVIPRRKSSRAARECIQKPKPTRAITSSLLDVPGALQTAFHSRQSSAIYSAYAEHGLCSPTLSAESEEGREQDFSPSLEGGYPVSGVDPRNVWNAVIDEGTNASIWA